MSVLLLKEHPARRKDILFYWLVLVLLSFYGNGKELDFFLLDQTRTRNGHEFYYEFSRLLMAEGLLKDETVLIREFPHPVWGNKLIVFLNDIPVYQTTVYRRGNTVSTMAVRGVEATKKILIMKALNKELNEIGVKG
ncbi:MAG: hypothetical protein JW774_02885 [Candidatus Aureabacteria bacterium]|nr:hypothetical protein [Candidatus Auribacterota bacterium]